MRYIRTKNGIYDLEKSLFHQYNGIRVLTPYCKQYEENPSLCKTADTIEELCDEFDWKWNEKEFPYSKVRQHSRYSGYGDLERAMRDEENYYGKYLNHDYEIYGAIWTDKGLIYVAKMNEKGKMELL